MSAAVQSGALGQQGTTTNEATAVGMDTLGEQITAFASLGEVFDPATATDRAVAVELAEVLTGKVLTVAGGPLAKINGLNRVLRVLRLAGKLLTEHRNREAYAANSMLSHKKMAKYLDHALVPTVQRWCEAGRKAVEASSVSA